MATNRKTGYKKKGVPDWLKKLVTIRDDYTCQLCGKVGERDCRSGLAYEYKGYIDWDCTRKASVRFEFDHIIPEYLGGLTVESNIQLTCRKCNRSKGYGRGTAQDAIKKNIAI